MSIMVMHHDSSTNTTCTNTFAGTHNVIDDFHNNDVNFPLKYIHFGGDKILF